MNRSNAVFLAAAIMLVAFLPPAAASFTSDSLTIRVYADGSAFMEQHLTVSSSSTTIEVPLLSSVLSNVVATDQNDSPLSFEISAGKITLYTLGATGVTLRYDSLNLTSKTGTVWTLQFSADYNSTVVLPRFATLSYVSGIPYSVSVQNDSPVATISPGRWEFSYGVPIGQQSSTDTTSTSSAGPPFLGIPEASLGWVLLPVVAVAVSALLFRWWRRRLDLGAQGADLRADDIQVLNFIQEKGGKVLEPEIRMRFALPKTSAWRQIKRLERLGYVRVTKIGSQNQIELLKNKEPGV